MIRRIILALLATLAFGGVRTVAQAQPAQWNYTAPGNVSTATYPGDVVINGNCTGCGGAAPPITYNCGTLTLGTQVCLGLTATWNAGGQTFTGIKLGITDTASAAASKLIDLQVGGVSQFTVDKTGATVVDGTFEASGVIRFTNLAGVGTRCINVDGTGNLQAFVGDCVFAGSANTWTNTQTFQGAVSNLSVVLDNAGEVVTVTGAAPAATTQYDVLTQSVQLYTTDAANNWTLNVRGAAAVSLDTIMATGQSVTIALLTTQGGTAFFQSAMTIDGNAVTPKWQGGTAPSAGNINGIDAYTVTIIKTAAATFTVLAAQTQYK